MTLGLSDIKIIFGNGSLPSTGPYLTSLRQVRRGQKLLESVGPWLPSTRNNPHAKVACFGVMYSVTPQSLGYGFLISLLYLFTYIITLMGSQQTTITFQILSPSITSLVFDEIRYQLLITHIYVLGSFSKVEDTIIKFYESFPSWCPESPKEIVTTSSFAY